MSTGIIILAVGHPLYTQMAVNLAASIKFNAAKIPICLLHDGAYESLCLRRKQLFDDNVRVENTGAFSLKTRLYEFTPYDRTLYMDADTIVLPKADIETFIKKLRGFNIINNLKDKDFCIWAEPEEVRRITGNNSDPFYHYFSEMMFFEKNYIIENYFKEVRFAYVNTHLDYRGIADQMPDELAYLIASMRTGVKPDIPNWSPLFWHFRNRKDSSLQAYELSKKYIGYSIGGNNLPEYVKATYNNCLSFYEHKMNIKGLTRATDKRLIFRNRINL